MSIANIATSSTQLTERLHQVLQQLQQAPFPHVPSPEGSEKRASVALILRIRPSREHLSADELHGASGADSIDSLNDFFSKPWVRDGDPEVLFIKRAGRQGDRWSGRDLRCGYAQLHSKLTGSHKGISLCPAADETLRMQMIVLPLSGRQWKRSVLT